MPLYNPPTGGGVADGSTLATGLTFPNAGLHILDTNATHDLIVSPGSDLTGDRTLTVTTGDANRTFSLLGALTVESASLINQDLTTDATPTFAGAALSTGTTTVGVLAGAIDAGGAISFEIPNSAAPTVNADGEIALDTSVADWSHGIVRVYGGEELFLVSMPVAQLTTPSDGYVVAYNATADEFQLAAPGGGSGANTALSNLAAVAINTSLISDTDNTDALGSAAVGWSDLFLGSGAVIGFANSNVVMTHTSGILTLGTGTLKITTPTNNTTSVVTIDGVQTLSEKRIVKRRSGTTSASSLTPNCDNFDLYEYTALAAALTINNPTGTPDDPHFLAFVFKDNATPRALTWDTAFAPLGVALPATTTTSKRMALLFMWNAAASKWYLLSNNTEA